MDEIEIVKIIKKLIKIFLILQLPIILILLIKGILKPNFILISFFDFFINVISIIAINILIFIVGIIIVTGSRWISKYIKSKKSISKNKEYIRDIEIKYSPAIISLILDLNTTVFKDYTAMLLYLCYRKYLETYKEENEIKFRIINENVQDLNPHEQYVYSCINGGGISETKFKKLVLEDARGLGLITMYNGNIERTAKGEKEAELWKGFKNYLHDYTLISEKNIDYMVILDEYIPYAIALDEAKNIEKFIADDENYRNLIYKFYNGEEKRFKDN